MRINQSLTKRVSGNYCPKKVHAELTGVYRRPATEPMVNGQYFEYLLFGTKNREGKIPVMATKKNGEKKLDQIRIEEQAKRFPDICKKEGIEVFGTDRVFFKKMFGYDTHGIWDAYGLFKGKPTIMDIKLTKDVTNDFGDFGWGDFESMDKIQAHQYMEAGKRMDGITYDFLFLVFDYKPKPEYRLFHVPYSAETPLTVEQKLKETEIKLKINEQDGWPAIGVAEECSMQRDGRGIPNCPFADSCPKYTTKKESKKFWRDVRVKKSLDQRDLEESRAEMENLLSNIFN